MIEANQYSSKRIAINTAIIYLRMFAGVLISLLTTRYVLATLGVSDYGLYNVVGGIITMLNVISIGMHTTTRRYINVELGKGHNGNLNKIFNVCLVIHFVFALMIFVVALTVGLWYINNILNVSPDKLNDAIFVYMISTITSAIGLVNIPFQGLMMAFERFKWVSLIDFSCNLLKIPMVVMLVMYQGNHLRFYAVAICVMSTLSFIAYQVYCQCNFKEIVQMRFYRDRDMYREIVVFNNYTSLGAAAYLGRTQGASILVNYFFGTIVNGAFAIAYQIEGFVVNFINNLSTAANPQITQTFASGNHSQTFSLVENVSRYSIYVILMLIFPAFIELDFLLTLWLGKAPDGTLALCQWTLLSLFVRSAAAGLDPIIQASGHVKWYQIIGSTLLISGLPVTYMFYTQGFHPSVIIKTFIVTDMLNKVCLFLILHKISDFSFMRFFCNVYKPVLLILLTLLCYYFMYNYFSIENDSARFVGIAITFMFTCASIAILGLNEKERMMIYDKVLIKYFFRL